MLTRQDFFHQPNLSQAYSNKPSVVRLAVHLPGEQTVTFDQGSDIHEVAEIGRETTLTAWFKHNAEDGAGRHLVYADYPSLFRWDSGMLRWVKRKREDRDKTIGRVFFVSPRAGELYYLRLLLHHVPGATSFENLRCSPSGDLQETFQEACRSRGLLNDDKEWRECLREAAGVVNAPQLRSLFAAQVVFIRAIRLFGM